MPPVAGDTIDTETFTPRSAIGGVVSPAEIAISGTTGGTPVGLNLCVSSVSSITDTTVATTLTIDGNDQNNIIRVADGPTINGQATNVVQGIHRKDLDAIGLDRNSGGRFDDSSTEDDNDDLEPSNNSFNGDSGFPALTFANKTNVHVNALGGDDLVLLNVTTPALGLTNLTLDGGTGDNVLGMPTPVPSGVTLTKSNFWATLTDPTDLFIEKLYQFRLGRNAEDEGRLAWRDVFQQQGQMAVVRGIEESLEARNDLVQSWYQRYLGRDASGGEDQGFVNLLMQGTPEETVLSYILGSSEFYARAQTLIPTGTPDERFVRALYLLVLNRDADQSEVDGYVIGLPTNGNAQTALGFLRSQEFRANEVFAFYHTLLHRGADDVGAQGFVSGNASLTQIREGFEISAEFLSS